MDSTKGGLLVGHTDKDGGKGIVIQAPEGEIRMGGGEIILNERASTENCETLSQMNQAAGGVAIPCGVKGNIDTDNKTEKKLLYGGKIDYFGTQIDDREYAFKLSIEECYNRYKNKETITLGELITHPELFSRYPRLKEVKVTFGNIANEKMVADSEVHHDPLQYYKSKIFLNLHFDYYEKHRKEGHELRTSSHPEYSKEGALLHEIQHLLQQGDRRNPGRGYKSVLAEVSTRLATISVDEQKYFAGLIYRAQPSEQEAMHTVYYWLRSIGREYGDIENIDFEDQKSKEQKGSQDHIYDEGGLITKTMSTGGHISEATKTELDKAVSDLHRAEKVQKQMKDANAIIRSKKNVTDRLISEAGLTKEHAEKIQTKDFAGRIGFPTYALTNNNANIKRLQDRVNMLEKKVGASKEAAAGNEERYTFEGGEIFVNYPMDRVQLLSDSIPSSEIRTKLKGNGYKWSPTNSAWQRKITPQAISNAIYLMGAKKQTGEATAAPEPEKEFNISEYPRMIETRNFTYVSGNIYNAFNDKEYPGAKTFNLVYFGDTVGQNVISKVRAYLQENLPLIEADKVTINVYPKTYVREAKDLLDSGMYLPSKSFPAVVLFPMYKQLTNYFSFKADTEKEIEAAPGSAGTVSKDTMEKAFIPNLPIKKGGYTDAEIMEHKNKHAHPESTRAQVRSSIEKLNSLDMWVEFPDGRWYRKFQFTKEQQKSGVAREMTDHGVKESLEEKPSGIMEAVISVRSHGEAEQISKLWMELNPITEMKISPTEPKERPFIALYNGQQYELYGKSLLDAKNKAVAHFKAKKPHMVSVHPAVEEEVKVKAVDVLNPNTGEDFDNAIFEKLQPHDDWKGNVIKERVVKKQIADQITGPEDEKEKQVERLFNKFKQMPEKEEGKIIIPDPFDNKIEKKKVDPRAPKSGERWHLNNINGEPVTIGNVFEIGGGTVYYTFDNEPLKRGNLSTKDFKRKFVKGKQKEEETKFVAPDPVANKTASDKGLDDVADQFKKLNPDIAQVAKMNPNIIIGSLAKPEEKTGAFKGVNHSYKNQYELNKAIEALIDIKAEEMHNYSSEEKVFLRKYSGYGGLDKYGATGKGGLFEYYTPRDVIERMYALAYKYGYNNGPICEPSCATGEFFQFAKPGTEMVGYEINRYSALICKALYPSALIVNQPFEQVFIKKNWTIKGNTMDLEKFDLVIGNPPYGDFSIVESRYMSGMGEKDFTKAHNYVEYFIRRGIDLLNKGGLLIYIVGAQLKNGGTLFLDSGESHVKEYLMQHTELLDAYRLPDSIFERTGVTSDIIVLRKK